MTLTPPPSSSSATLVLVAALAATAATTSMAADDDSASGATGWFPLGDSSPFCDLFASGSFVPRGGHSWSRRHAVQCQEESSSLSSSPPPPPSSSPPPNPMWPSGISKQDVKDFVEEIMADPDITIAAIPDALERQIYATTVRLTLNAVYQGLGQVHGLQFLAHEMQLRRFSETTLQKKALLVPQQTDNAQDVGRIDQALLDEVADRLLANRAINLRFVPDAVERQVYKNCLKLVFRLLDICASTFRLTLCGHDISIEFQPSRASLQRAATTAAAAAASSRTAVDVQALQELARLAAQEDLEDNEESWWSRLWQPSRVRFMAQLHSTLYGLILGIVDDLLANTELELLNDRIRIDIVPASSSGTSVTEKLQQLQQQVNATTGVGATPTTTSKSRLTPHETTTTTTTAKKQAVGAFAAGVGLGAAAATSVAWMAWGSGRGGN